MARANTKIGDVFSVKLDDKHKKYFQYITNDLSQLNSDVIRAFKETYAIDESPDLSSVINDEVDFYAHCVTKFGIKMGLWEKVGNISEVGDLTNILFRGTNEYGIKLGEEPIKISDKWYVWNIGREFRRVGKLKGENKKAEIGLILIPNDIVDRMKTGRYNFFYPGFE